MSESPGFNPYQAPAAPLSDPFYGTEQETPTERLYSPHQIMGATWLGSPFAGSWLLAANYRALGRPELFQKTLSIGAVTTLALFLLTFALPASFPNSVLPIAYSFAMLELAKRFQGPAFDAHIVNGGPKHSPWRAAGIGLLSLLAIVVVAMTLGIAYVLIFDAEF